MEESQDWLNEELIISVLKASTGSDPVGTNATNENNFIVVNYETERAVDDGKNFSSKIHKVSVTYKDNKGGLKHDNFIMKRLISSLSTICNREEAILKALLKIEKYVKSTLGPKLLMVKDCIVVMDDLMEQGFQNSKVLLDYDHCVLALKNLANFHAGSVQLHKEFPKLVEDEIGSDVFYRNELFDLLLFFEKGINSLGEEISSWPESQKYAENFKYIATRIRGYYEDIQKRKTFRVLNHGDFWLNNMMFKYDSETGKVCGHRIVDLQTTRFMPPSCDFQYFIGSSANFDVRLNRMDELITVYLETFNNALVDLGLPHRMTREQFDDSLKEDNIMYVIGMTGPLFIVLTDPAEVNFSLEDLSHPEDIGVDSKHFKSEELRKLLPPLLNELDKQGFFRSFRV